MNLVPMHDNVVLAPIVADSGPERTESGLWLPKPEKTMHVPHEGRIVSVGPELKSGLKIGDRVIYLKVASNEVHINSVTYVIVGEKNVLVKVEE